MIHSRAWLRVLTPMALHAADAITTVSAFTRDDLLATYRVRPDRVRVIHPGAGKPPVPGDARAAVERFALGDGPVLLTFGVGFANKNIDRLIDAFALVGPQRDATLVHVGLPAFEGGAWRERAEAAGVSDRVRFAGRVDDATLEDLYAAATVVVLPSRFEGFGLPLIEAMRRGVPVASADTTSLPEVGGDAAAWFDPLNVGAMAETIGGLLDDPARREALVAAGLVRARAFSTDHSTGEYVDLYRSLAGRRRRGAA